MSRRAADYPVVTTPDLQAFIDYYAGPRGRAPKLTPTGYAVRSLAPEVLAWLTTRLTETWGAPGHPCFEPEHPDRAQSARNGLLDARWDAAHDGGEIPTWVNKSDFSYDWLLWALLPEHEEWAGIRLQPSQFWGPRVYRRHAVLGRHVDRPQTHVVSSSITIAAQLDEPWPLVIEREDGEKAEIDIAPGQMLLIEGSRLPHYRPVPLAGEHFINFYLHYHPAVGRYDSATNAWILK